MAHLSSKQKSPQVPWTVHDVGDIVGVCDFIGCTNKRHKVVSDDGCSGDTFHDMGRNMSHHKMDMNQHTTTYISIFDEDQRWCLESAQHVGIVKKSKLPTKDAHTSVQPAKDPLRIYLHLSPLGGESTSTQISNFHLICILMQWIEIQMSKDSIQLFIGVNDFKVKLFQLSWIEKTSQLNG
jgi:hypothetical protein